MKKIAIIGAGISGLVFANFLENDKSCSYKIFEKKNSLNLSDGYGIQLSANSVKILNTIGFQKMNANDVCLPKKVNFFDAKSSKKICEINISQFNNINNRYTTLKRSKLIELLLKNSIFLISSCLVLTLILKNHKNFNYHCRSHSQVAYRNKPR